jgi:AcrR family transcriptional regulator
MPRPRSDEKRTAILEAATRVIVAQGLSAPTMGIAKEAGIANGSLFTYFETKTDLFNQLYLELKTEMAAAATKQMHKGDDLHEQFFQVWQNWTNWAITFPEKRRALAQLSVSGEITPETHAAARKTMMPIGELLERCRAAGPMSKVSTSFVGMLMNSVAEGTMDFMSQDPKNARKYCKAGFDAVWRIIT